MNIQEMHNTFRTIGQQNGMQLIRSILPESIDVYLNDVIIEKAKVELLQSVSNAIKDSADTKVSTMSSINAFRTLYRNARFSINTDDKNEVKKVSYYNQDNGFHIINIPTIDSNIAIDDNEYKINPMMFLGFSVEYENTLRGNSISCRLIGSDVLETTLNDYCNGASKEYPIAVIDAIPIISNKQEQNGNISNNKLEIYTDTKNCKVKFLNIKYIKYPNIVRFDKDLSKCVNCDFPDYIHFEIVERAAMKFIASISSNPVNFNQPKQ